MRVGRCGGIHETLIHAPLHREDPLDKPTSISRAVHGLAYATGLAPRLTHRLRRARIVMLHGVGGDTYPEAQLEQQLHWLARHFCILPLSEIVALVASGETPEGNEIALTFDDGLRNNAQVAAPMLTRLGIPATFFVCPDLIESGTWLWNHEMRARLGTQEGASALVARMKALGPKDRAEAEARVRADTATFTPSTQHAQAYDMMSLDELRALDPTWITIGSHSLTHPILPTLDDAQLEREIRQSRERLEVLLDRPVAYFCYPDGALDDRAHAIVAQVYEAAVTTHPGHIPLRADLHRLPRIGAVPRPAELAWRLYRP